MLPFRFCSLCGSALTQVKLSTEDRPRLVCLACGHIHYINPKIVCGTLPVENGSLWLLRRGIEPRLGYWSYPAGFQEWDESSEEAACRETKEELGCEVNIDRLLGVYSSAAGPVVNIVYLATLPPTTCRPTTTLEAIEVRAFTPSDLPWDQLAFPSTRKVLEDWLKCCKDEPMPRA